MAKILLVEDEESILIPLEDNLKFEGYHVSSARDGEQGLFKAREQKSDLIILDIMLPKINGLDICKQLRQEGIFTPILMLTAKGQEIDKVLGLELGADDYMTKPYSPRELLARVKALLRRVKEPPRKIEVVRFGDVEIDFVKYEVKKKGKSVYLTALEFDLLHFLIEHKGQVKTRDSILDGVWGDDSDVYPRTVDKHIAELRKKLEKNPPNPVHILGVRSVGYKFVD